MAGIGVYFIYRLCVQPDNWQPMWAGIFWLFMGIVCILGGFALLSFLGSRITITQDCIEIKKLFNNSTILISEIIDVKEIKDGDGDYNGVVIKTKDGNSIDLPSYIIPEHKHVHFMQTITNNMVRV